MTVGTRVKFKDESWDGAVFTVVEACPGEFGILVRFKAERGLSCWFYSHWLNEVQK